MNSKTKQSLPPTLSCDILSKIIGKKILGLVRYSWWPKVEISNECRIENVKAFSLTAGPLAVIFEGGTTLGVASDPKINSIIVWFDRENGNRNIDPTLDEDVDLFPIDSSESNYAEPFWSEFTNCVLVGLSIFKKKTMSIGEKELASEVGLCFHFNNGMKFIATHGLHNESDDFSVLGNSSLIDLVADGLLEEIPLL